MADHDTHDRLERLVAHALARQSPAANEITPDTAILGPELGLDSVGLLDAILDLEESLGITLRDEDLTEEVLASVRAFTAHLVKLLSAAGLRP